MRQILLWNLFHLGVIEMSKKIISDTEIVEPKKIIKEKKRRIQIVEETVICPICKAEVVFKITNTFLNGGLKKSDKEQETWFHNPLTCLKRASKNFEHKEEVDKCGNCKHWAGHWSSNCGEMRDEYCTKHSRLITQEEYDWVLKTYPEKLTGYQGKIETFDEMQKWYNKLKYVCYEDEWCEYYEDDK